MESKTHSHPDRTIPPYESEKTNPHIELPPSTARTEDIPDNPLEALVPDVDEHVKALEERLVLLNTYIANKTYEYGGIKLAKPKFTVDLELTGEDENGVQFVVPKEEVHLFLDSIK
jgi:hypothetical protein